MHDDNVYTCQISESGKKKYVPFGRKYSENYLPDGIWYVRHNDHGFCTSNLEWLQGLYKVGDAPKSTDFPKLCATHDYAEYVLGNKEFIDMTDKPVSLADIVHKTVALILQKNQEEYKNEDIDTR